MEAKYAGETEPAEERASVNYQDYGFAPYGKTYRGGEETEESNYATIFSGYMGKTGLYDSESVSDDEEELDDNGNEGSVAHEREKGNDDESNSNDSSSWEDDAGAAMGSVGSYVDSDLIKIPETLSIFSSEHHWLYRFVPLTKALQSKSISLEERVQKLQMLAVLEAEFVRTATFYGKVIIGERYIQKKTIPPIDVGGTAGGIKYIKEGILFKFAWDNEGIYAGDMKAMKVATQELNCMKAIYLNLPEGILLPLMVAIDFKGFKLLAMCLLPVNKNTLIYGSCDGGVIVKALNDRVNDKMAELGSQLNLKRHTVGFAVKQTIHMPADIEVHKGTDGNFYMLDFARVWPPEVPTPGMRACFLIRHLRGEFVRSYHKPLSPDSFSRFQTGGEEERSENSQDVIEAFQYLLSTVIPGLVDTLQNVTDPKAIYDTDLAHEMHERGVNMRHLGVMWNCFTNPHWRRAALTDAACRVAKRSIQSLMRKSMESIKMATDEPFIRVIVGFINFLFGDSPESLTYWNNELRWGLEKNFFYLGNVLKKNLRKVKDIKASVNLNVMFERLLVMLGLEVSPKVFARAPKEYFFNRQVVIEERDIVRMAPVVVSGITDHPKAFLYYQEAFYHPTDTPEGLAARDRLLLSAIKIFSSTARYQSSNHYLTFRYWSKSLLALSNAHVENCVPPFIDYTKWLIHSKSSKEENPATMVGFFLDYLYVIPLLHVKLLEMRIPKNASRTGFLVGGPKTGVQELLNPLFIAAAALPITSRRVLEEWLPRILHTWPSSLDMKEREKEEEEDEGREKVRERGDEQKKEEKEKRNEKGEEKAELFERLTFFGGGWLTQDVFLQVARLVRSVPGWDGLQSLRLASCQLLGYPSLFEFLELSDSLDTLTSLELEFNHEFPRTILKTPEIYTRLPNLRRLVLHERRTGCEEITANVDWFFPVVDNLSRLTHLEITWMIGPRADKLDWLSRLEILRTGDSRDLLLAGYQAPKLRSLQVEYSPPDQGWPNANLSGLTGLRHLSISRPTYSINFRPLSPDWATELSTHCKHLETLELPHIQLVPEVLDILASSDFAKILRKLTLRIHLVAKLCRQKFDR